MPLELNWTLIIQQAIANIPTAIITGTALFWATHLNRKIVDSIEKHQSHHGKNNSTG